VARANARISGHGLFAPVRRPESEYPARAHRSEARQRAGTTACHMKPANGTRSWPTARKLSSTTECDRLRKSWTPPAAGAECSSSFSDDGETWNQSFNGCSEGPITAAAIWLRRTMPTTPATWRILSTFSIPTPASTSTPSPCRMSRRKTSLTNRASGRPRDGCLGSRQRRHNHLRPYHTKLIMPESDTFNPIDAAVTLSDPSAEGSSALSAAISMEPRLPLPIPAGDTSKEIWMTSSAP